MDASERLADYFEQLIDRVNQDAGGRPATLPEGDRIIYYVVSVRCEIDINGFESVFDQFLNEGEIRFLIESFQKIDASALANAFKRAYTLLDRHGFFQSADITCADLSADVQSELNRIETEVDAADELWQLDARLVDLIE